MRIIAFVMETETDLRAKIKEKSNRQPQCSPMTSKTKKLTQTYKNASPIPSIIHENIQRSTQ